MKIGWKLHFDLSNPLPFGIAPHDEPVPAIGVVIASSANISMTRQLSKTQIFPPPAYLEPPTQFIFKGSQMLQIYYNEAAYKT